MPAGTLTYLVPGQRYLVYGRHYDGPDMFMSAETYGTKPLDQAAKDLEFLNVIAANASGATIDGVRPGKYVLGRGSFNFNGVSIPAVYYPGTSDRTGAMVIVVHRSSTEDVGEFRVPRLD